MSVSAKLVEKDSTWRQRSELEAMAELPSPLEKELQRLDGEFWVSQEKLKEIVQRFQEELDEGLQANGRNIPMNLTWVHGLPTGKERGKYLTLDLGGTNLRVCLVTLHGEERKPSSENPEAKFELLQEQYKLPPDIKTGNADELWDHVAEKLAQFLEEKGLTEEYSKKGARTKLGFTFSYPATQASIDHAVLQTWTKGFDIKGVEGQDVASQLRAKLEERRLPLDLICVINDTVGALVASAYNDPDTIAGAIFGTGCNAAYMSSLSSIKKLKSNDERLVASTNGNGESDGKMAINCEYGAFDNAHRVLPRTNYDLQIDEESPRPGEQSFEKLSAGLYLGEIFRLVILDLASRNLVFESRTRDKLEKPYAIDTGFLSQIEDDESDGFTQTRKMFKETLGLDIKDEEIELSRRLAEIIAVRGARLCACGIAAICQKEGIARGHVAADGSVANKHPKFKRRWATALGEILDWEGKEGGSDGEIVITSAEDGSGVGCAIIAAMETKRRGRSS